MSPHEPRLQKNKANIVGCGITRRKVSRPQGAAMKVLSKTKAQGRDTPQFRNRHDDAYAGREYRQCV